MTSDHEVFMREALAQARLGAASGEVPVGAILASAMLLRYSFKLETEAICVESAVAAVLAAGSRTKDLAKADESILSTSAMGKKIAEAVRERVKSAGQKAAS